MSEAPFLRMEPAPDCLLCGAAGENLYEGLEDRLYGVPGRFSLSECSHCGFVWLDPRPVAEDIPKMYPDYHAHKRLPVFTPGPSTWRAELRRLILEACYDWPERQPHRPAWRLAGRLLGALPPLRRRATHDLGVLCVPWHNQGRLLDVGCGTGVYLARMRRLGWSVQGVELDAPSAAVARQHYDLPVFVGALEEALFPDAAFDAITMNHVFEHVAGPTALLAECRRVLSAHGYLVLVTPNVESVGHRVFGRAWRGLEPPRHLYLWRPATLRACVEAAGFRVVRCFTRSDMAPFIYGLSRRLRAQATVGPDAPWASRSARLFQWWERLRLLFDPHVGEEVCLVARKPQ